MATDELFPHPKTKWYEIWWFLLTHPRVESFREVLNTTYDVSRGLVWVAVASVIPLAVTLVFDIFSNPTEVNGGDYLSFFTAPIGAVIGVVFLAAFYHFLSKLFGGSGKWSDLCFCFSAISAPLAVLLILFTILLTGITSVIVSALPAIPAGRNIPVAGLPSVWQIYFIIEFAILAGIAIYVFILYSNALAAAENMSIGRAIMTFLLIPLIFGGCALFILLANTR